MEWLALHEDVQPRSDFAIRPVCHFLASATAATESRLTVVQSW
jgi:hypothetical protein